MADSPTAAPERDVLLATELFMPATRSGLVPRPRLTARLDEGLPRGLVLVCAPAGYGKTVLLADWARRGGYPVAWLSLDAMSWASSARPTAPRPSPGRASSA